MSFTVLDGFKQVTRVKNPLSRERQRLASLFDVGNPALPPLPHSAGHLPAHNVPSLWLWGARPGRRLRVCLLQAPPLTPAPSAHNVGDCGRRANGYMARTGLNGLSEPKTPTFCAYRHSLTPCATAPNSKALPGFGVGEQCWTT
jgi:hypothetical protein